MFVLKVCASPSITCIFQPLSPSFMEAVLLVDTNCYEELTPRKHSLDCPNCWGGDWSFSVKIRSKQSRGLLGRCPQHYFLTSFIVSISLNQVKTEAVKSSCLCVSFLCWFSPLYYNKWLWGILCNLLTLVFKVSKLLCLSPQLSQHPILLQW